MFKSIFICVCFLCLFQYRSMGQILIYGPTCVIPNAEYQYDINGAGATDTVMNVCITGGRFLDRDTNCYSGATLSFVRIMWDEDTANAGISISTANGVKSLSISLTAVLDGGKIDSTDALQVIQNDSTTFSIHCSPASGGNCQPFYSYQWQQSTNGIQWTDITGILAPNLDFSGVSVATYFRRKVKELASNTIEYSDFAIVNVP